ncbi:MAG: enoyl-CoA hydratase, partial [Actinomycetota bacterium]
AADDDARAVVLTGAGRAFSAGGSFDDFERRRVDLDFRAKSIRQAREIVEAMIGFALPVVAAVNGPAVGLGCTIATLCDIVFIASETFIADPHVSVALVAGDGGAVGWPASTSLVKAKQYMLTGDRIPADVAVEIGLANFSVPKDDLLDAALAFAHRLAAQPPQAVQQTKLLLNRHLKANAERALQQGLDAENASHDTPEYKTAADGMKPKD